MKIYVASSWRNKQQPLVVQFLRGSGHEVYDFRNPEKGNHGFHWSQIDPDWKNWNPERYRDALDNPIANAGFQIDLDAMYWCDACVLVMPCGRSAHLELGWAAGVGKRTIILLSDGEPELMYKLVDHICLDIKEVVECLR